MTPAAAVTSTAAVAMSTASGGGVVIWAFKCLEQGQLIVPDQTTAGLMAAFLFPTLHLIRNALVAKLLPDPGVVVASAPVQDLPKP